MKPISLSPMSYLLYRQRLQVQSKIRENYLHVNTVWLNFPDFAVAYLELKYRYNVTVENRINNLSSCLMPSCGDAHVLFTVCSTDFEKSWLSLFGTARGQVLGSAVQKYSRMLLLDSR